MFYNLVNESLDDILKPKTPEELEHSVNNARNINLDKFLNAYDRGYIKTIPEKAVNLLLKKSCQENNIELIDDLIKIHKADINFKDNYGNTPLYQTCKRQALETFKKLIKYKNLDINVQNKEGVTPLMACTIPSGKHIDYETMLIIFDTLIKLGADLTIKNPTGWNIQDLVLKLNIRPIIYYMQEHNLIKYDYDSLSDIIRLGTLKMLKKAIESSNLDLNIKKYNKGSTVQKGIATEAVNLNDTGSIGKIDYLISLGAKITPDLIERIKDRIIHGYFDEQHKNIFRKFLLKNNVKI
jgi:ankyrin repeat protein